eukprot:UN05781
MQLLLWLAVFTIAVISLLVYTANWLTRHFTSLHDLKLIGKPRNEADKGNTAVVLGGSQ